MSSEERRRRVRSFLRHVWSNENVCDFGRLEVAIDFSEGGGYPLRLPIKEGAVVGENEPSAGDFSYYVDFALQDHPKEGGKGGAFHEKNSEWIKTNKLAYHGACVKCRAVFDAALYPAAPPMYVGVRTSGVRHMDLRSDGQLSERARAVLFGGDGEKHTVERVHDKLYAFFCGPVHPCESCNETFRVVREINRYQQRWSLGYRVDRRRHPELFEQRRDHLLFPEFSENTKSGAVTADVEGLDPRFYAMLCELARARKRAGLEIEDFCQDREKVMAGHCTRTNDASDRPTYLTPRQKICRLQQLARRESLSQSTRRRLGWSFHHPPSRYLSQLIFLTHPTRSL